MSLLFCAATIVEARAVKRAVGAQEVLTTGMGPILAARALRHRLAEGSPPSGIISTGFAGSLHQGAKVGTWALGVSVRSQHGETLAVEHQRWVELFTAAGLAVEHGSFYSHDSILLQPVKGADFVDRESYALATVAHERELPISIVRMVSDTPDQPLPPALAEFARTAMPGEPKEKLLAIWRGVKAAAQAPSDFARFLQQARPLPERLSRGWAKLISVY